MNRIGIMNGRLSLPVDGRIQVFPASSWRDEFPRAAEAGMYCIEWIYDEETEAANPIRTDAGLAEMGRLIEESGVQVISVCADYYMTRHLVDVTGKACEGNIQHLEWLLGRVAVLGVQYMVLPFVDASSLKSAEAVGGIISALKSIACAAETAGTELHVESDLQAAALVDLLERVGHPMVRANYDIGNSASLGNDPGEELPLLAPWLGSVHVKDRLRGGTTVPLGSGAADFATCFEWFGKAEFKRPYILQVARGEAGREVESAIRNRAFVEQVLFPQPA